MGSFRKKCPKKTGFNIFYHAGKKFFLKKVISFMDSRYILFKAIGVILVHLEVIKRLRGHFLTKEKFKQASRRQWFTGVMNCDEGQWQ
jgi:hypothetical protein